MASSVLLQLFVPENQRHHGELLFEWLLERSKSLGIPGGSAFRAIAGYGRHGSLHQEGFFEIAVNLPIQLEFVLSEEQVQQLLNLLRAENLSVFYTRSIVESGITGS